MYSTQPTWWDVEKVIQCNSVSYVVMLFIYMWYNPLGGDVKCKEILYIGIRNLSDGEVRISCLSIPLIVVHGRYYYSQQLFTCLFIPFSWLHGAFFLQSNLKILKDFAPTQRCFCYYKWYYWWKYWCL